MTVSKYLNIKSKLVEMGYGQEIEWQTNLKECINNDQFANETVWVILNSGMREQIARKISDKIYSALQEGRDISTAFGHKGKVAAIEYVIQNSGKLFCGYVESEDKISFLETIPFIGKITKYHLAKNLGHNCVKPDRHLTRVAKQYDTTPDNLCEQIAKESGDRKCVVDIVIWRACNLNVL
jgi:hypothetical protein